VTGGDVVVLPLTWRSYARACFFTGIMFVFGLGTLIGASGWLRPLGALFALVAVGMGSDFVFGARRWRFVEGRLCVPRLWAPNRAIDVSDRWTPGLSGVGRGDSMFRAPVAEGHATVAPNILVARSDVMQWLHLIGQARSPRE
jgi:hypothetical protein